MVVFLDHFKNGRVFQPLKIVRR